MLSQTAEYALRATLYLARDHRTRRPVTADAIARALARAEVFRARKDLTMLRSVLAVLAGYLTMVVAVTGSLGFLFLVWGDAFPQTPGPYTGPAYVLVIVLGISLFVAAHYYKIVPFLVWYHRFGPLAGKYGIEITVVGLASARAGFIFDGAGLERLRDGSASGIEALGDFRSSAA